MDHARPRALHLIVAHAAPDPAWGRVAPPDCPALAALWPHLEALARVNSDAYALTTPHERAWAEAIGLRGQDGHYPLAALATGRVGTACAWITPCHWQLATDHVTLTDPARLGWSEGEAESLRRLLAPWFAEDGLALDAAPPDAQGTVRWMASGPALDGLACASIDRAVHRHVDRWLQGLDTAPALKRLQTEVQMLLYDHPSTTQRIAQDRAPINSFWVSGAGCWDGSLAPQGPADVQVLSELRNPYLGGDPEGWRAAWQRLDAEHLAPLTAHAARAPGLQLTLCGEHAAQALVGRRPSLLHRLRSRFHRKSGQERAWELIRTL